MKCFESVNWQYCLPQHALSRAIAYVANCEIPLIKNTFIQWFIKRYSVDLNESVIEDPQEFDSFNQFFTRALKADARPIASGLNQLIAPADGQLSEYGQLCSGQLLQAKGQSYSVAALLGGDAALAEAFHDGHYLTVYLAPSNYHRVHMPFEGRLIKMIHVPGQLFSVNAKTAAEVPNLFARNERVICLFDTSFGPMAVILVGAMIVASIATVWHGQVTPVTHAIQTWDYVASPVLTLAKGAEMGRFYLGSTAIVLTPAQAVVFAEDLSVGQPLKMGQALGTIFK